MKSLLVFAITILVSVQTVIGQVRTVSDLHITLDEWAIVPTLIGNRVESFVALRDPASAVGDNVTAVWFLRIDDRAWRTYAWHDQDNYAAIAHIKGTLGLDDSTDASWPVAEAQQGVDVTEGSEPDKFATGVFEDDPFAPIIDQMSEPGVLIESLDGSGWSAARISIWTETSDCTQNEILSGLAAMVEADIATGAGGALVAGFSIPQTKCDEWVSLSMALRPDGTWTVPDLSPYFESTTSVGPGDGWQALPQGTVFTGEQTIVVDGGGVDAGGQQVVTSHFVITTKDVTKPSVALQLQSSDQPFVSPGGGHPYFVTPTTVTPLAVASDAVDASPTVSVWHNGQPYVPGTQVSEPGVHTFSVLAVDSAGNEDWSSQLFEIRSRRNFGGDIYVADLAVTEGPGGIEQVVATLRLTSIDFDVKSLNPGTIDLWLVNEDGAWIEATGGAPVLVDYEDCRYEFVFVADFSGAPLAALPPGLAITGRGLTSTASEYDFVASAPAQIDIDPFVPPCGDTGEPDPPDPAPCEWVIQPCTGPAQSCTWSNFSFVGNTPGSASVMGMWVTCTTVTGSGYCWITVPWPASVNSVCSKVNGGTMNVFLSGDDCCTDCTINVVASPKVTGTAKVDPLGSATVSSTISVGVGGTGASASGSVSLSNDDGGTITINGVPIPVGAGTTKKSYAAVAQPPLNQNFQTCSLSITIATAGTIDTNASTNLINWYGYAGGAFGTATPGLTITPQTNCGEGEIVDPIVIDHGP